MAKEFWDWHGHKLLGMVWANQNSNLRKLSLFWAREAFLKIFFLIVFVASQPKNEVQLLWAAAKEAIFLLNQLPATV